jgi:hypothetical protein
MPAKPAAWALLLVLPVGFAGVWRLQRHVNIEREACTRNRTVLVRSPRLMKMMTLEYSPLIADIYWTRAVQYYGGKRLGQDTNLEACGRCWMWPLRSIRIYYRPIVLARHS